MTNRILKSYIEDKYNIKIKKIFGCYVYFINHPCLGKVLERHFFDSIVEIYDYLNEIDEYTKKYLDLVRMKHDK